MKYTSLNSLNLLAYTSSLVTALEYEITEYDVVLHLPLISRPIILSAKKGRLEFLKFFREKSCKGQGIGFPENE